MRGESLLGQSVIRAEGLNKVKGAAIYTDDYPLEDFLWGVTIRSNVARGKILSIEYGSGIPWNEFVIVSAKDIPGKNVVALILNDQPILAEGQVNHREEPILLLAHRDRHLLEKARSAIQIRYQEIPPVFALKDSLHCEPQPIWGKDNIFKKILIEKGDIDSVWSKADYIIEGSYATGAQEQLYIEPNAMIALYNPKDGSIECKGSMQCPYYVLKALIELTGLPKDKITVTQLETGGGFGGKEEYPSILAGHVSLLALKAKKNIKMIYDRAEDMAATTKRHPSQTRHKTAVSKDGRLLAMDIEFNLDGGAYATLSAVVLSRGAIHAAGPYECPNVRISARALATNYPPHGAFRGFGAPQSIFALERHLDIVAKRIGLEPDEFRRRNFISQGKSTATGQVIREPIDMPKILAAAQKESRYQERRAEFSKTNSTSRIKRGIGLATFMHGAGFTGSGEKNLASKVAVGLNKDGRVEVFSSSTEIGQGTNTIFAQIAASALGLQFEDIIVVQPSTRVVPDSGPTVASRTCMVVGKLVESACEELKSALQSSGLLPAQYTPAAFRECAQMYLKKHGALRCESTYQQPPQVVWDDQTYRGDAYATYAWACYVACVSVDLATYTVTVDDFVAVQDVGSVVHPLLAAGQIEGGVAQAIGYALYEKVEWRQGVMANARMTNYIMPTSMDLPDIRCFFVNTPSQFGPGGAKGIGELPMDGVAPAIMNAIHHALGDEIALNHIPFLPEDLFAAKSRKKGG